MRSCAAIPSRCRLITFLALLGVASGLALSFVLPLPTNSRCPAPSPVAPTHLSMVADSNASDQAASSKRAAEPSDEAERSPKKSRRA